MSEEIMDKRDVLIEFGIGNASAALNALHQAGWAIVPKREASQGYWEQRIANEEVRRMRDTGVCPTCGERTG